MNPNLIDLEGEFQNMSLSMSVLFDSINEQNGKLKQREEEFEAIIGQRERDLEAVLAQKERDLLDSINAQKEEFNAAMRQREKIFEETMIQRERELEERIVQREMELEENILLFEKEKNFVSNLNANLEEVLFLNVGGTIFNVRRELLCQYHDSMLARMFSGRWSLKEDRNGNIFIDRDPKLFSMVLSLLRDPEWIRTLSRDEIYFLKKELLYFGIETDIIHSMIIYETKEGDDYDDIFHYIGTNFGKTEWRNPMERGLIRITGSVYRGALSDIVNISSGFVQSPDAEIGNSFTIDLISYRIQVSRYMLFTRNDWNNYHFRNWNLEGSNDNATWVTLITHQNDESLNGLNQSHSWDVDSKEFFQYFRLTQTGKNSSGRFYFATGRMKLFGKLTRK
jgi:hypothetical protein